MHASTLMGASTKIVCALVVSECLHLYYPIHDRSLGFGALLGICARNMANISIEGLLIDPFGQRSQLVEFK